MSDSKPWVIPQEFLDWVIVQWWGPPAFGALCIITVVVFGAGFAIATER